MKIRLLCDVMMDNEEYSGPCKVDKIGLIAGNGNFPIIFAKEAAKRSVEVVAIGIKGETETELEGFVERFCWINLGQLSKLIRFFKQEGVNQAVMVGQIKHVNIFRQFAFDLKAISFLNRLRDKKADTILAGFVNILEQEGITILPSTTFLAHLMPDRGVITKRPPNDKEAKDIDFGTRIAKGVAGFDIGQTVVVKNSAVIAVEAMEGTDETILRAGMICGKGSVIVKVSKPKQDFRFDVPVIGLNTIKSMVTARAAVLAVDARRCLFFDRQESTALANHHKISIIAQ